jgi:hypothetical protein
MVKIITEIKRSSLLEGVIFIGLATGYQTSNLRKTFKLDCFHKRNIVK